MFVCAQSEIKSSDVLPFIKKVTKPKAEKPEVGSLSRLRFVTFHKRLKKPKAEKLEVASLSRPRFVTLHKAAKPKAEKPEFENPNCYNVLVRFCCRKRKLDGREKSEVVVVIYFTYLEVRIRAVPVET